MLVPGRANAEKLAAALTAATDKARREALEQAAQYAETFAKDNSAHVPQGKRIKGDLGEINMWMRAAVRTVASDIRALAPQSPGDAAPHQEGEE